MNKSHLTDKQLARYEAAQEIVHALFKLSQKFFGSSSWIIYALATRIALCNSVDNLFTVPDAINFTTGEEFEATGHLWSCGSKLCPNCLADHARRNRKKLRDAIDYQTPRKFERYYFLTFTIVNPKSSLLVSREIVNRAWSLFRKRSLCVDLISGGSKSEEFTLTANGFHYHLHCLVLSRYLHYQEVRRVWTECVEKAFGEYEIPFEVDTKDGYLICKFHKIESIDRTIQEVCKYITKSDSWYKMRESDLRDVALIKRWSRMFEVFGSFAPRSRRDSESSKTPMSFEPIVHTSNISDGSSVQVGEYWRDRLERISLEEYLSELHQQVNRTWTARLHQLGLRYYESRLKISPYLEQFVLGNASIDPRVRIRVEYSSARDI